MPDPSGRGGPARAAVLVPANRDHLITTPAVACARQNRYEPWWDGHHGAPVSCGTNRKLASHARTVARHSHPDTAPRRPRPGTAGPRHRRPKPTPTATLPAPPWPCGSSRTRPLRKPRSRPRTPPRKRPGTAAEKWTRIFDRFAELRAEREQLQAQLDAWTPPRPSPPTSPCSTSSRSPPTRCPGSPLAQGPAVPGPEPGDLVESRRPASHRLGRDNRHHPARHPRHPRPRPRRPPRHQSRTEL
jgi:hypothetical protein